MVEKRKYFGTDGIRGRIGDSLIHPEFIIKLGWAVGKVVANKLGEGHVLIGKDTRISGYMFESALEAGLSAAGIDIYLLGPMPTPATAYLTRTLRAHAGIVISASHNPYYDNGIKFFFADGKKIPDHMELEIEDMLDRPLVIENSKNLGKAIRVKDAVGRYIEFCKGTIPTKTRLDGLKIAIDCAHGATYHIAPEVFKELGANVVTMGNEPNGFNINENCGSTSPGSLRELVLREKADLGLALDGDGDRVIMIDHKGEIVDGDEVLYIITKYALSKNQMHGGIVGTIMSNMGLECTLRDMGVEFIRTKVGDRHIIKELSTRGWHIGGEPSGHIINSDINETGDGIIAALQVITALVASGRSLHELKNGMHKYPQILKNVATNYAQVVMNDPELQLNVKKIEKRLGSRGRVLIRSSGTEPVLRIMVEGEDYYRITEIAETLEGLALTKNKLFSCSITDNIK